MKNMQWWRMHEHTYAGRGRKTRWEEEIDRWMSVLSGRFDEWTSTACDRPLWRKMGEGFPMFVSKHFEKWREWAETVG